jgi:Zn-dependent M28 family amino/carboxypeptidase
MKNTGKLFVIGVGVGLLGLFVLGGCVSGVGVDREVEMSVADRLEADVRVLSEGYGGRSAWDRGMLDAAGMWVAGRFEAMGYSVVFEAVPNGDGSEGFNVIAELVGTALPDEIVVVGAHYDAEVKTPGADDNASGVAGMLELARRFAGRPMGRTVRFVGFTNEEGSNSRGGKMGSRVSAANSKARGENIVAMMSIEMIGYYSDEADSQRYPFPPGMAEQLGLELPTVADFISVVGRFADRALIERMGGAMIEVGGISVVPVALPAQVPALYRSDHANYWFEGYPAVMVTDTSEYRFPHYHQMGDVAGVLDFGRMRGVVDGLEGAVRGLGN